MLKLRLSQTAEKDLEDIWSYTLSTWGKDQALAYLDMFEKGLYQILENPLIGKARPEIKPGYRALQVGKHLIFYLAGTEFVDVIGIPHQRMDILKYFHE